MANSKTGEILFLVAFRKMEVEEKERETTKDDSVWFGG
jgi:hypothetical protein